MSLAFSAVIGIAVRTRQEYLASLVELAPQPSLTDIDHLIAGVRAAGLPVHTTIHGNAPLAPAANSPSTASSRKRSPTRSSTAALERPRRS